MKGWCFLLIILLGIASPTYAFLGFDFHSKPKSAANLLKSPVDGSSVKYIHRTIDSLHYSAYKMGGSLFDTMRGVSGRQWVRRLRAV